MSNEINNVAFKTLAYNLRDDETRKKAEQLDTYAMRQTKVYEAFANPKELENL